MKPIVCCGKNPNFSQWYSTSYLKYREFAFGFLFKMTHLTFFQGEKLCFSLKNITHFFEPGNTAREAPL